jgi:hypothetical protein
MMLIIPSTRIKIHAGTSRFALSSGPYCDGFRAALSPDRARLQKIDSISASCSRIARGISVTDEHLELFMGHTVRFRRALPRLHDRTLEPVQHYGSIPRKGFTLLLDLTIHVVERPLPTTIRS